LRRRPVRQAPLQGGILLPHGFILGGQGLDTLRDRPEPDHGGVHLGSQGSKGLAWRRQGERRILFLIEPRLPLVKESLFLIGKRDAASRFVVQILRQIVRTHRFPLSAIVT
jgi:hypothetical protein